MNPIFAHLYQRQPQLNACAQELQGAYEAIASAFATGGKLLLCGNGGSAADCAHIAGEFIKGFLSRRPLPAAELAALGDELGGALQRGLPCIDLCANSAAMTAIANDQGAELIFAQQVMAFGRPGDVLLALSTSGGARNCAQAVRPANALGLTTLGLTGQGGGELARLCNICIRAPHHETYRVQELHLMLYHALCAAVEAHLFP